MGKAKRRVRKQSSRHTKAPPENERGREGTHRGSTAGALEESASWEIMVSTSPRKYPPAVGRFIALANGENLVYRSQKMLEEGGRRGRQCVRGELLYVGCSRGRPDCRTGKTDFKHSDYQKGRAASADLPTGLQEESSRTRPNSLTSALPVATVIISR
jgi:hypothetical protein